MLLNVGPKGWILTSQPLIPRIIVLKNVFLNKDNA